jgi:hypothetical protein
VERVPGLVPAYAAVYARDAALDARDVLRLALQAVANHVGAMLSEAELETLASDDLVDRVIASVTSMPSMSLEPAVRSGAAPSLSVHGATLA